MPPRRSFSRRLRNRAESALVSASVALARIAPVRLFVRTGEWLGGVAFHVDRRRRKVAESNLELAYGAALPPGERRGILRGVYRHLGRFVFEYLLLLARRDLRPLSRFMEFENAEMARAVVQQYGAAIFVTLHQGHWEMLGGVTSEQVTQLHAVMMRIRNPRLNDRIVALRANFGMALIERKQAVPALFRHLRRGKSVGLVCDLDQDEGPDFCDFFGVPAATVRTPAILAVRTRKPIICFTSWSTGEPLRYRALFAPPIVPREGADADAEAHRILVEMNLQLETFVRSHPEQWNWIHPRWKTRPPAGDARSSQS